MSAVIEFEHVTKTYRLGTGQQSLREAVSAIPRQLFGRGNGHIDHANTLQAVNDVSFRVERGTTLGIIGRNGAGKTTILKLLSGVTKPTQGKIHTKGRISALIELGAGFHPDLTGRENVYLNGAILGLSKREIDQRYDQIVEFAELAEFMDTPVKRYSSGMYARLGFAVAAHVEPDLLLVDEVLAVGDVGFQRKCYDFIHAYVTGGKTAVFVSHNMLTIEHMCNRVIWLDKGQTMMTGTPVEVLPSYFDSIDDQALQTSRLDIRFDDAVNNSSLHVIGAILTDVEGNRRETFCTGDDIVIHLSYRIKGMVEYPHFILAVSDGSPRPLFFASMLVDGQAPSHLKGDGTLRCYIRKVPLLPGTFDLYSEVWDGDRTRLLSKWNKVASFRISGAGTVENGTGKGALRHLRTEAVISVAYEWRLPG